MDHTITKVLVPFVVVLYHQDVPNDSVCLGSQMRT